MDEGSLKKECIRWSKTGRIICKQRSAAIRWSKTFIESFVVELANVFGLFALMLVPSTIAFG
ncbi:hypothetical protein YC2023_084257 [Brassica napus]